MGTNRRPNNKGNKGRNDRKDYDEKKKGSNNTSEEDPNPSGKDQYVPGLNKRDRKGKKRANDPNWYFVSREQAEEVMTYSFENILGLDSLTDNNYVPAIAAIYCNPSPGVSITDEDPGTYTASAVDVAPTDFSWGYDGANYMASKLYTMLSANSGRNAQYQANDILFSVLSINSIAEAIESLRRLFGLTYTYSMYNRAIPQRFFELCNIDFADFKVHIADYRTALNYQITRINQIPILANLLISEKSVEMYQRVFKDDDSNLAQYFFYVPATVWELDETSYTGGTGLNTISWMQQVSASTTPTPHTIIADYAAPISMGTLILKLSTMIDQVLNSTTLNLVYMDLINMASKVSGLRFMTFDLVSETYGVLPELDTTALLQFHNMRFAGNANYLGSQTTQNYDMKFSNTIPVTYRNDVASDPNVSGRILYNPAFYELPQGDRTMATVDFFSSAPTLEDKVEAQRMAVIKSNYKWYESGSTIPFTTIHIIPDHYPLYMRISDGSYVATNGNINHATVGVSGTEINLDITNTVAANLRNSIYYLNTYGGLLTKFNYAPNIWLYQSGYQTGSIGDLTYFTNLPWYKMSRATQVIYAGLFAYRSPSK